MKFKINKQETNKENMQNEKTKQNETQLHRNAMEFVWR